MNKYKNLLIILNLFFITACSTTQVSQSGENFFDNHTTIQLLGWLFFPRLMFIFFSAMTGGFLFWVGVIFVPRIMVAFWATTYYWDTNPILCLISWIVAFSGESSEKSIVVKKRSKY